MILKMVVIIGKKADRKNGKFDVIKKRKSEHDLKNHQIVIVKSKKYS